MLININALPATLKLICPKKPYLLVFRRVFNLSYEGPGGSSKYDNGKA